jgi:hypothetical protein
MLTHTWLGGRFRCFAWGRGVAVPLSMTAVSENECVTRFVFGNIMAYPSLYHSEVDQSPPLSTDIIPPDT